MSTFDYSHYQKRMAALKRAVSCCERKPSHLRRWIGRIFPSRQAARENAAHEKLEGLRQQRWRLECDYSAALFVRIAAERERIFAADPVLRNSLAGHLKLWELDRQKPDIREIAEHCGNGAFRK